MGKMGISRGKSPLQLFACSSTVFAIAICLFFSTKMASAWINKCLPGDLFIDSNQVVSPASCDSGYCTNWCKNLCSGMGTFASQDRCRITQGVTSCKCCCKRPGVYLPPDDSDWGGLGPGQNNNCSSAQTFLTFRRTDGNDCMRQSICDGECSKLGLLSQRTECVANSNDVPNNVYIWWEQCCCGTNPPPPPSCPSPPPPSPPPPPPSPPPPSPSPPPPCPPPPHTKLVDIEIGGGTKIKIPPLLG
ncbi:hypothetical protein MKW92_017504 [Papaver armeniacum]|nr:hypothetical protein MKW92_017504 [Papaver armeniacum]